MNVKNQEVLVQNQEKSKGVEMTRDLPVYSPATDIYEKEDSILVVCDMPGVDDKQVDITLENGVLTLTGCADTREPDAYELAYRGHQPGVYRRSFTLSTDIDHSKIKASISKGVLQVVLPKAEKATPRKIKVEVGS